MKDSYSINRRCLQIFILDILSNFSAYFDTVVEIIFSIYSNTSDNLIF